MLVLANLNMDTLTVVTNYEGVVIVMCDVNCGYGCGCG